MSEELNERNSMVFYDSYYEAIMVFPSLHLRVELLETIINYGIYGKEPSENASREARAIFCMVKPLIDSSHKRYDASVKNGKKGGNPNFAKGKPNPYYAKKNESVEVEGEQGVK